MATVTSITAARAEEIYNASIVSAELVGTSMVLRSRGGAEFTLPNIKASTLDAWPIGSIFIGVLSTSPATLLGGGTWVRFSQGKVLVGLNEADTDFDTVEESGGSKTHTLVAGELPPHAHTGTTSSDGSHTHSFTEPTATPATVVVTGGAAAVSDDVFHGNTTGAAGTHSHTFTTSNGPGASTPFSVVQPYTVVYMWKRTA